MPFPPSEGPASGLMSEMTPHNAAAAAAVRGWRSKLHPVPRCRGSALSGPARRSLGRRSSVPGAHRPLAEAAHARAPEGASACVGASEGAPESVVAGRGNKERRCLAGGPESASPPRQSADTPGPRCGQGWDAWEMKRRHTRCCCCQSECRCTEAWVRAATHDRAEPGAASAQRLLSSARAAPGPAHAALSIALGEHLARPL
jgi:hypothetical protein